MGTTRVLQFDGVIMGGGVAGLWLLNCLVSQGYNAILLEQTALGAGQTIASQGMIHGGVKYTLAGALSGSSEAIADMPNVWRACFRGEGEVNLQQTRMLSDHFYMWSTASTLSKLTGFFASKALRGRVNELQRKDFPPVFSHDGFKGNVYELVDTVIDTPSLLKNLADNMKGRIFKVDWTQSKFEMDSSGAEISAQLKVSERLSIEAQQFIFSAGKGNATLLNQVKADWPRMQTRPLQQMMVKHHNEHAELYAHCMGADSTPRLTVSSHRCNDGAWCWYLGGQLAEQGVGKSTQQLIAEAKMELKNLFPWINWQDAQYASYTIERAEPKQKNLVRPEKAFIEIAKQGGVQIKNISVAWPTKLTLVPHLGWETLALLRQHHIFPGWGTSEAGTLPLPEVEVASSPWNVAEWVA